jgi:plasmid stability protein
VSRCVCGVPSFSAVHSAPQIEGGHRFVSADTVTRVADTVAMVVRIDADLHARLKALAEANDRTMAAEARRALVAHLDAPTVDEIAKRIAFGVLGDERTKPRAEVEPRFKP